MWGSSGPWGPLGLFRTWVSFGDFFVVLVVMEVLGVLGGLWGSLRIIQSFDVRMINEVLMVLKIFGVLCNRRERNKGLMRLPESNAESTGLKEY